MKLESKYLILATIACFCVVLDQLTKLYVHTHFALGESFTIIPNLFAITYVRNLGAAFGIFHQMGETFRNVFFLSMPPIAMIVILAMLRGVANTDRAQVLSLSLIFGGAIGNYIDRLRYGFVVDFLDFHWKGFWTYPAFNVADSAIVVGVCALLFLMTARDMRAKKTSATKR